jgi:hypothetical protein
VGADWRTRRTSENYFELEDKKESEFEAEIGQISQIKDREIKLRAKKCAYARHSSCRTCLTI